MSKLSEMMDNLSPARDEEGHPITQRQWDGLCQQLADSQNQPVVLSGWQQLQQDNDQLRQQVYDIKNDAADLTQILVKQQQERYQLHKQVTLLREALKQARHMIYYDEPQLGWSITRIDEVLDATEPKP